MIATDRREILRYLGYWANQKPDETIQAKITRCLEALQQAVEPRFIYRVFPLTCLPEHCLNIDGLFIKSVHLSRNLQGCSSVCLLAVTLGVGADRLLARASVTDISDAAVCQAAAAAMTEAWCDEMNEKIRREMAAQQLYCRPRFSPGYGDFSITHQRDLTRLLDTRKIGLTVTESCLLAPAKSITAVIGLCDTPQPCHQKGCESCDKTNCTFKR